MKTDNTDRTNRELDALGSFLEQRRGAMFKSEEDVATELGFSSPKVYRLIVQGKMKLPLSKIPAAARALGTPDVDVLRAILATYCGPEIPDAVDRVWGTLRLSENERKLIEGYRNLGADLGVEMRVLDSTRLVAVYLA